MSELISDNFYYSSRDISCRKPFGAIVSGKRIEFNFYAKFGVYVNEVYLVINLDGQEEEYVRLKFKENKDGMSRFSVSRRFDIFITFRSIRSSADSNSIREGMPSLPTRARTRIR